MPTPTATHLTIGIGAALAIFLAAVTLLTTTDRGLTKVYETAFSTQPFPTTIAAGASRHIPATGSDHGNDTSLRLTNLTGPLNPAIKVFGALEKGDRITVAAPNGGLDTLEITGLHPLPISAAMNHIARSAGNKTGERSKLLLITCRSLSDGTANLHILIQQPLPAHPVAASDIDQPL